MKAIFAVMRTTQAVVKISSEKNQAGMGFETMAFAVLVQCSTELTSQLGAGYYVSSSETREVFLKSSRKRGFKQYSFPPLVKLITAIIIIDI